MDKVYQLLHDSVLIWSFREAPLYQVSSHLNDPVMLCSRLWYLASKSRWQFEIFNHLWPVHYNPALELESIEYNSTDVLYWCQFWKLHQSIWKGEKVVEGIYI